VTTAEKVTITEPLASSVGVIAVELGASNSSSGDELPNV
jgi:hypothetical protein